jgi:Fic family protein
VRALAAAPTPLGEAAVCELHRRIVLRSQPEIAGIYTRLPRRIAGSPVVLPNPAKIPQLMGELDAWLKAAPSDPPAAFEGHFRLTAIHPFADGNGRTARLLMNVMLIRGGYPPIAVRPQDRKTYLDALECGSLAEDLRPFQTFMQERLDATLEEYLGALREASPT